MMLHPFGSQHISHEWVGLYINLDMLEWVVSACYHKDFRLGPVHFSAKFMDTFPKSTVGS